MKLLYFDDFKLGVLKGDAVVDVSRGGAGHPAHRAARPDQRADRALRRLHGARWRQAAAKGSGVPVSQVRIRPPLPQARTTSTAWR